MENYKKEFYQLSLLRRGIASMAFLSLFCSFPSASAAPLYESNKIVVGQINQQQVLRIQGMVVDANGEPIIGASVLVVGTSEGTITDLDGHFNLSVSKNASLKISFIGYEHTMVTVTDSKPLKVILAENNQVLDEVVVVGYGKMKKGDLSASIATVENMDKLQKRPVTNIGQLLQGQVAGVSVVSDGGHLSGEPTITIRGMGSPNGESPLYVVDGVPGATFNLSDIESITVLKDAASAAIYGAYAGSAGVILVTTKQAEAGKTKVSYNGVLGVSNATNLPQSLTWDEEYNVRKAAYAADGQSLPVGWDRINEDPVYG